MTTQGLSDGRHLASVCQSQNCNPFRWLFLQSSSNILQNATINFTVLAGVMTMGLVLTDPISCPVTWPFTHRCTCKSNYEQSCQDSAMSTWTMLCCHEKTNGSYRRLCQKGQIIISLLGSWYTNQMPVIFSWYPEN